MTVPRGVGIPAKCAYAWRVYQGVLVITIHVLEIVIVVLLLLLYLLVKVWRRI